MILHALILGWAALTAPAALDAPEIFRDLTHDEAVRVATAQDRLLLVDFTASWCAPCHQMDATTWVDPAVVEWIDEHALAVQIDVDEQGDVAGHYGIRAMPTVVVVREGEEFDRVTGYRDAEALIGWLDGVRQGRSALDSARDVDETDVQGRYDLAQMLASRGELEEAGRHYLWLWEHALEHAPSYSGVRLSFMASSIAEVVRADEATAIAFEAVFLRTQEQLTQGAGWQTWRDWQVLGTTILGRDDELVTWILERRQSDGSLPGAPEAVLDNIGSLLVEHGQAAAAGRLIPDLVAHVRTKIAQRRQMEAVLEAMEGDEFADMSAFRRQRERAELLRWHQAALAAERWSQVSQLEEIIAQTHATAAVRIGLVRQALDAGRVDTGHLRLAADAMSLSEDAGEEILIEGLLEELEQALDGV